ncbi:hypothetical protein C5167_044947 [Papaver somniferum]|uniref:Phosphotransferase n=1 Tax=Papaver somniferum TaxID=3469 RepID=A0A4Y7L9G3_PAPSO|nr:hypothetical protein C5167_044947 [Papaver somniferum]
MGDSSNSNLEKSIVENLQASCATPDDLLRRVAESMIDHMSNGLAGEKSDLKMLLSYVNDLPTGQEKGLFYALDLGGTNFRVLRVRLDGRNNVDIQRRSWVIPKDLKTGTKEGLFGFIASGLSEFVQEEYEHHKIPRETKREIGFTFSFPVNQTSINEGILLEWNKGFNVSDTIGKDVVACLKEAMKKANLDMFSVTALVNDSVGALAGAIYMNQDVKVAVILGTGSNACYIERMDAISKIQRKGDQDPLTALSGTTIINTEWGYFSDQGVLPYTEFDVLGTASHDKGKPIFVKMISGYYLGKIVSKILLKMAESSEKFAEDLNHMHSDNSDGLETVGSILSKRLGLKVETTLDLRTTVVQVIDTIIQRAARLAGAGILAILQKMEQDTPGLIHGKSTVVAIDGSLYEQYYQFKLYLEEVVTELLGPDVVIKRFQDASGVGAALLAQTNSTCDR